MYYLQRDSVGGSNMNYKHSPTIYYDYTALTYSTKSYLAWRRKKQTNTGGRKNKPRKEIGIITRKDRISNAVML